MKYDICVIGGGAAGMMSALCAKRTHPDLEICIIERLSRVGKKLSVTGNGRCNLTNKKAHKDYYIGRDNSFVSSALAAFSVDDTVKFFGEIGIPVIFEGEKAYPRSLQAASVTDALRFALDDMGISFFFEEKVLDIAQKNDQYEIVTDKNNFLCRAVVVATGGLAGGEKMGCDASMFDLLKKLGLTHSELSPAIVQLKTETDFVKQLKGVKVNGEASIVRNGKKIMSEYGEILFCDYGLSGPPILQLSAHAIKGDTLSVDLLPDLTFDEVLSELFARKKNLKNRSSDEFLSGLLQKRLGQIVQKRSNISLNTSLADIDDKKMREICSQIKKFNFSVLGNTGFSAAQATLGGLLCEQFNPDTMECCKRCGLFAAGEILDVCGYCGGFNLQWAWSSGYVSGVCAAKYVKNDKD